MLSSIQVHPHVHTLNIASNSKAEAEKNRLLQCLSSLGRRHTHTHTQTQDQTCVTHRQHAAGGVGAGKPRRKAKEARKKAPRATTPKGEETARQTKQNMPKTSPPNPRRAAWAQGTTRKAQGNSRRRERKHSYNTTNHYIAKEGTEGSTQGKARVSHLRTSCSYMVSTFYHRLALNQAWQQKLRLPALQ